jgi:hypothetical protein
MCNEDAAPTDVFNRPNRTKGIGFVPIMSGYLKLRKKEEPTAGSYRDE